MLSYPSAAGLWPASVVWGRRRQGAVGPARRCCRHQTGATTSLRREGGFGPEAGLGIPGGICGKCLAQFLAELVPIVERHEELVLDDETRTKLLAISAASIDRALAEAKAAYRLKERGGPRPSSSLLHRIPIQTHSEATADRPIFVEIDLVGHDGGTSIG